MPRAGFIVSNQASLEVHLPARLYKNVPMNAKKQLTVISDLDGTLLDHYSYQFDDAQPALAQLAERQIPLILNSSKTAAEIIEIRNTLGNKEPFIAENGGGIYLPQGSGFMCVTLGIPREEFLPILASLRHQMGLSFTGFCEMGVRQLMGCTGLSEPATQLARQRDFTEPLLWQDSDEALLRFTRVLNQQGLQVISGGPFVHISGQTDKGKPVDWIREYFQRQHNRDVDVIALGDSDNDIPMLARADHPFIIRSPVHAPPSVPDQPAYISKGFGPKGWNECIGDFLRGHEFHLGPDIS